MRLRFIATILVTAAALVPAVAVRAKKTKPPPCPAGRFLINGNAVIAGDTAAVHEPVVVGGGNQLSIGGACAPVGGRIKAAKKATMITASWPSCTGLKGRVKLTGSIAAPACDTMTGRLVAKKEKPKVKVFTATRSRCGDGIFDRGGEQCDAGAGCGADADCTSLCACVPRTTTTTTTTPPTTTPELCGTTTTTVPNPHCGAPPATCGDGHLDPGEECDDGPLNDGTHCSANCTLPACGNCSVDPGETCDDGNAVDDNTIPADHNDSCPSSCVIHDCTVNAGTTQTVSVNVTTVPGVVLGALTVFVDYPEGQVRAPATTPAGTVIETPNDVTYGLKDALLDQTFADGIPANGAAPALQITFKGCQGKALPAAVDYRCTVLDAALEDGTAVCPSTVSCAVTIP